MSDEPCGWPEQDAIDDFIDKWRNAFTGQIPREEVRALKRAVTQPRIDALAGQWAAHQRTFDELIELRKDKETLRTGVESWRGQLERERAAHAAQLAEKDVHLAAVTEAATTLLDALYGDTSPEGEPVCHSDAVVSAAENLREALTSPPVAALAALLEAAVAVTPFIETDRHGADAALLRSTREAGLALVELRSAVRAAGMGETR